MQNTNQKKSIASQLKEVYTEGPSKANIDENPPNPNLSLLDLAKIYQSFVDDNNHHLTRKKELYQEIDKIDQWITHNKVSMEKTRQEINILMQNEVSK